MPVPTPWIRTYDTPELYLGGYRSGLESAQIVQRGQIAAAEIANRQQQLQQQGQIAQMEMDAKMKVAEMNQRAEQQRLQIQQAYHESQLGLQSMRLQQAQEAIQLKTMQAAKQAAAQMRIQARVKAGEDYNRVVMEEGASAGAGFGPAGVAAMQRAQQAVMPKELEMKEQAGKQFYRSSAAEPYKIVPGGGEDRVMSHAAYISGLANERKLAEEYRLATKKKVKADLKVQLDAEQRRLNDIAREKGIAAPFPNVREAGLPMPKTKKELVKGELYQTNRGLARWDGEQFIPQ